jgi:hypothetical protein
MEREKLDLIKKIAIVLGICLVGYFFIVGPYLGRGEGDPYFVFIEVPVNETVNSSVVHLEDKNLMNIRGLDVRLENGTITRIYVRSSETMPGFNLKELKEKIGSYPGNQSSRKFLEYKGVYYYATWIVP